jgi:hypothetical protein
MAREGVTGEAAVWLGEVVEEIGMERVGTRPER